MIDKEFLLASFHNFMVSTMFVEWLNQKNDPERTLDDMLKLWKKSMKRYFEPYINRDAEDILDEDVDTEDMRLFLDNELKTTAKIVKEKFVHTGDI